MGEDEFYYKIKGFGQSKEDVDYLLDKGYLEVTETIEGAVLCKVLKDCIIEDCNFYKGQAIGIAYE